MIDDAPKGHVKIARKTFESDAFWLEHREFSRWEAWVFVIQLACFSPYRHQTDLGAVDLERGEFVASLRWLGSHFKWNLKRVRYWVATCQKGARLRAQRETPAGTVYLIVNYDIYQAVGHSEGTDADTPKGTAGAQQGHKREAVKSNKTLTTLSESPDVVAVLEHYLAVHPTRRAGKNSARIVRNALAFGYPVADLKAAIDGNAADPWHRERNKHELSYVLRNEELIDTFREKATAPATLAVVDGWMSAELERRTRPVAS